MPKPLKNAQRSGKTREIYCGLRLNNCNRMARRMPFCFLDFTSRILGIKRKKDQLTIARPCLQCRYEPFMALDISHQGRFARCGLAHDPVD